MRTDAEQLQVHAYVDGAMDLPSQLAFEQRLAADPALRAQVDSLRALSQSLREGADYHAAPAELRARITRAAAPAAQMQRAPGRPGAAVPRRLLWNPLVPALAFVAIGALALNVILLRIGETGRAREELVASHVRATLSQRAIDVASSDQHTVRPWFSTQLDFSPPVRELRVPGIVLLGGRVDYVQGRKVAVVVYQYRKHGIDLYLWPAGGADSGVDVSVVRGFKLAQWTQGGMAHRLVSDLNDEELQRIVEACREAQKG